jgi:hypothetical protein
MVLKKFVIVISVMMGINLLELLMELYNYDVRFF